MDMQGNISFATKKSSYLTTDPTIIFQGVNLSSEKPKHQFRLSKGCSFITIFDRLCSNILDIRDSYFMDVGILWIKSYFLDFIYMYVTYICVYI